MLFIFMTPDVFSVTVPGSSRAVEIQAAGGTNRQSRVSVSLAGGYEEGAGW
jgi:hypothetical protein